MMYLYELAWVWHEDYEPHLFVSDKYKTEEEWEKDCIEAIRRVGDEYIKNEERWISMPRWIEAAAKELEKMGYKSIKPVRYSVFGGYIIEEYSKDVREVVGKRLFIKAVKKNEEIEGRLFGRVIKNEKA